jgi:tRNA 2-thiouridine synthesizing protein A
VTRVPPNSDDSRTLQDLLLRVDQMRGRPCGTCGTGLCGHALLLDVVAGFQGDPICPDCLAAALGRPPGFVTARVRDYVGHRECTRAAWEEITRAEPDCALARAGAGATAPMPVAPRPLPGPGAGAPPASETWDAGDLGCGDLVLELRNRMKALAPRGVLHLVARDPGAPADIPAWCALTGHRLLAATPPHYHLRRKDD